MEKPRIISMPTAETKKGAATWQKKEQKRQAAIAATKWHEEKSKKAEIMKDKKTNQEIADMPEFQSWCKKQGTEPTKRQAAKYREEFETYLSSLEENSQLEKAA